MLHVTLEQARLVFAFLSYGAFVLLVAGMCHVNHTGEDES